MFGNNNPLQSIQLLGLLNAAKTGDPTVDAAIAVALPIVASYCLGLIRKDSGLALSLAPFRCWLRGKKTYTQTITHRSVQFCGVYTGTVDKESQNEYLVRAIKLFIHQKCHLDLDDADVDFSDVAKRKSDQKCNEPASSTKRLLGDCEIVKKPPKKTWICTGIFDGTQVWMWMDDSITDPDGSGGNGDKKMRTVTITLRSSKKTSIDEFTMKALKWYEEQLAKLETHTRYFFDVSSFLDSTCKTTRCPVYHKYVLTGEKTFKTIFSQPAEKLLKIVDDFRFKRGKYGVAGFPYKLGILLHGIPGTGKTSMIKALAQHLNRHIVNVSLSKIERNQDLRDIFFNRDGFQRILTCKDIIFVLEDVDATSKVVTRRKELKDERHDKESETKGPTSMDALSLAGILNVFDGVVATPGRIIVMTTNYPELLDPALIRPGRIDKIIELSNMAAADAKEMLEHYFAAKMDKLEWTQLTRVFKMGAIVTPAQMERYILELDTIQEVIDAIDRTKRRRCSDLGTSGPEP